MIWLISKHSRAKAVSRDRAIWRTMRARLIGLVRGVDPRWGARTVVVSKTTGKVVRTYGEQNKAGGFPNAGRAGEGSGRARLYL